MLFQKIESSDMKLPDITFPPFEELYLDLIINHNPLQRSLPVQRSLPPPPRSIQTIVSIKTPVKSIKTPTNTPLRSIQVKNKLYDTLFDDNRYKSSKRAIDIRKQSVLMDKKIPTLKDIEKQNIKYDYEDEKRELLVKLDLLQKKYPLRTVPRFTVQSDYRSMKKTYDLIITQIQTETNVSGLKHYLTAGFGVIEMLLAKLGFDVQGYASHQILNMETYDKYLVELGERTYVPLGLSTWPVEVQLMFTLFANTAMYIIANMVEKKIHVNILNINKHLKKDTSSAPAESPLNFIYKKKMKGPRDEGFESG